MDMFETAPPSNVILLTVDCLRADVVGDTDFLSELAESNVDVVDSHCTGSGTPTSMPGIMQSRLPTDYGGEAKAHPLVAEVPTLAEVLQQAGYSCGGWHSNVYTSRQYGYQRGFDVFVDLKEGTATEETDKDWGGRGMTTSIVEIGRRLSARLGIERFARKSYNLLNRVGLLDHQPSAPADEVVDAVLKWLPKRDVTEANRFAWGHLMDPHAPYIPPERYRNIVPNCPDSLSETWKLNEQFRTQMGELSPEQTEKIRGLYDATVQFVDAELSRLVSTLKRRGIWDDTLLVVTADHGEMFNDRPIPDDFPFEHPNYLCDYVTRVPTIVSGGAIPAETVEEVASGMDIAPTFAALVDADCPDEWRGEALTTGLIARDAVYSVTGRGTRQDNTEGHQIRSDTLHASVRTSKHTVLWWSNDAYGPEAYDREGAHMDPTVHESPHKEIEDEVLQSHVETLSDRFGGVPYGDSETEEKMDAETKNRLRELGYLE